MDSKERSAPIIKTIKDLLGNAHISNIECLGVLEAVKQSILMDFVEQRFATKMEVFPKRYEQQPDKIIVPNHTHDLDVAVPCEVSGFKPIVIAPEEKT